MWGVTGIVEGGGGEDVEGVGVEQLCSYPDLVTAAQQ